MMIRSMLAAAALLAATPTLAQVNQPVPPAPPPPPPPGALYAGQPPLAGPMPGGMPREAWLDECARRLSTHGIDGPSIAPTCQNWWAYYQGGGAPDPVYGYTVPIKVTETRTVTRETIIETRHGHHCHRAHRKVWHDKRVRLK